MQLRSIRDNRYFYIDWWLMNHCNYNCSYCPDIIKSGSIDLPNIEHCLNFVDQVNNFAKTLGKTCSYYFTGGEVTQWPWLVDLIKHIKSKNSNDTFDKNFDQIDWSVKLEKLEEVIKDHEELLKDLKD
jgi:MoaA/NifB/PqqE/SkfB family radical SAM enzyme